MLYQNTDLPKESLQIKQDDKFCSMLISRESSSANNGSSLRVYYGVASGAVPFLWESQPGTPKKVISNCTLPPLSPPPSYFCSPINSKASNKSPKCSLIRSILDKLILRKFHNPSSCSISFPPPSESAGFNRHGRFSSPRSYSPYRTEYEEESGDASPTSTLCFRVRHGATGGLKGTATRCQSC